MNVERCAMWHHLVGNLDYLHHDQQVAEQVFEVSNFSSVPRYGSDVTASVVYNELKILLTNKDATG